MTELGPQRPGSGEPLSAGKQALLAQRLRRRPQARAEHLIPRRAPGLAPPLSYAQERLWFMDQLVPGAAAYTIVLTLRLRGPLDADALEAAVVQVADRHEALRTRFPAGDDGRPAAVVEDSAGVRPARAKAGSEQEARELVAALAAEPFDLAAGPLLRPLLVRLDAEDHVLALAVHHIACDGWSCDLLTSEILTRYETAMRGEGAEAVTGERGALDYGDFAVWQRREQEAGGDLAYWSGRLAGLPPLDVFTDHPRPARQTFAGAAHGFRLGAGEAAGLRAMAADLGVTMYMIVLSAWQALLGRYSGQEDFAVGSPIAGRSRPELEGMIGCFLNMLTMRADLSGDPTFRELLSRTRESALDAFAHQELPFERLVQELNVARDVSRPPLFQTIFAMQNYGGAPARPVEGLAVEPFAVETISTRFDLELYASEDAGGLGLLLIYNTDLFAADTVERMATHLTMFLAEVTARPDTRVSDAAILGEAERALVTAGFNATDAPFPDGATLHGLVEEQIARTPGRTAVTFEGASLTYAELGERADRVARRLRALGAGPGTRVAVCAERSLDLVAGLLGVLKAGAAYVPLDPEYPAERLEFMLADSGATIVLTQRRLRETLPATLKTARLLTLDDPADRPTRTEAKRTDTKQTEAERPPETTAGRGAEAGDVAYMIYTSGSTGRPKGVPNSHRGIVNRLDWMRKRFPLDAGDTVLQKTPASFDVSVWEFFWPLLAGARLVLARPGGHKDAAYLAGLIRTEGVTTLHFVPSMLAVFLADEDARSCTSLRRVICSGEELPAGLAIRCRETLPAELHNLYGPTEAAVDVSAWACEPGELAGRARVPIGAPIQNVRLYVLDPRLRPVPIGVPGELHIGGAGLAYGYHGRPALTAERFVPDPYGPPGSRLYRTGDLARWRADGTVDFLGRLDTQVKVRGLRIELGEIEAALRDQPGVRDAAVIVREDRPGDKRIVAYLAGDAQAGEVRAALKLRLPDYMVPSALVPLEGLPLSPNGKLDRRALPEPAPVREEGTEFVPPETATQESVAAVWRAVLGVERIGIDDDFFDLGGHSLLATQVIAGMRANHGAGVSVMDLFQNPTVRGLAALADVPAGERGPRGLLYELTRPVPAGERVLSYVCVPYGGGSAVVYQPLADALPRGYRLFSVAIPGHDLGVDEDRLSFDELASRCVAEILAKVEGPLALYGHCGVGSAMIVEIARRLEAAGRELDAVHIGAIFPFARPENRVMNALSRFARMEALRSDQAYANWLLSWGLELNDLDPGQARHIIRNMRRDSEEAEAHYTRLLREGVERLRAPIVTIAGERDPSTDYYQERFREWHFIADTSAVVVLAEAGHFFLKYRAKELSEIVTTVHRTLDAPETLTQEARGGRDAEWWLHDVSRAGEPVTATGPEPSMARFVTVAASQMVSMTGSALTEFAIPIWIYLQTGSLVRFALFAVLGLVPGMLVAPLAGAVVDRSNRRRVMLAGDVAAGGVQLLLGVLLWTGNLASWHIYVLIVSLSVALQFQRLAYGSSIPQLVPKQYLGHANGVAQMANGVTQLLVPLIAVGLMASIGLGGIVLIDVVSYAFAVTVLLFTRFPASMAWQRKEPVLAEIVNGFRYSWGNSSIRSMLLFFAALNIFLSPLFLLISPLVLSFGTLADAGRIAFVSGAGVLLGGLVMTVWGGPRRRRLYGMMLSVLGLAAFCLVTGLRPSLVTIAAGAFGMALWLTLVNGIYTTIVQVKVPPRFHGRVFALNTLIAWSTLPIGFGLVAPYGSRLFDPLVAEGGPLAGSVGAVIGVGAGRGVGLMYVLFALAMVVLVLVALRFRSLARFDADVPDAAPDDLVGYEALRGRIDGRKAPEPVRAG
ncbi:non-ribosomal peptide synthetase/MFS transporter [Sphaerisporangium corydalis]|uniref:Amino acid adenylation domain-containing protein n=1 Tax=Sphaerisporangium corydalis TaxID=1441875 RepID=A0ABV9E992_9ACTN|nr:non-ribosomal peptide synthetase/MFS transporter [Sphaerisporangium corydalis]